MTNILVLYSRLSGYWLSCMRHDFQKNGNNYLVISKSSNPDAPFEFQNEEGITIIIGDHLRSIDLFEIVNEFNPGLIYISGWSDPRYKKIGTYFKARNIKVIIGMDNHWLGTSKQVLGSMFSYQLIKKFSTHIWIPGLPQLFFAKKLGFENKEILKGLYCADDIKFTNVNQLVFNRQIIFVGRLVEHKGLNIFFNVLEELIQSHQINFNVKIIGNGPLKTHIPQHPKIEHVSFVHPEKLPTLFENAGFFILPSLYEAWGVALHEAVIAGMPVISTYQTGAVSEFVLHNHNGYIYDAKKSEQLKAILLKINSISDKEYHQMSKNSKRLSRRLTLDDWSATINAL